MRIKKSHPSDKDNSDSKDIMATHEPDLPKIPKNTPTLKDELGQDQKCCTWCGKKFKNSELSQDEIIPCPLGGRYMKNGPRTQKEAESKFTKKELLVMAKEKDIKIQIFLISK